MNFIQWQTSIGNVSKTEMSKPRVSFTGSGRVHCEALEIVNTALRVEQFVLIDVQSLSEKKPLILKLSWTLDTPGIVTPSIFVISKVMFAWLGCSRTSRDPSPAVATFTATSATISNKSTEYWDENKPIFIKITKHYA